MALAYTAPTWTDGSGEGLSASNLQAISNCIEGLVQGSDKAVHAVQINGSVITLTYADGTTENFNAVDIKGISSVVKTSTSGLVDTYTITYSDGTTSSFTISNGQDGQDGQDGRDGAIQYSAGNGINISDENVISATSDGDMKKTDYDSTEAVKTAGGIAAYVSSAISGKADDSDLDEWTSTATVSSGSVTFTGLSDSYAYWPYAEDTFCHFTNMTKSGSGSNVMLVITTDAADNTVVKLRILK